MPLYLNGATTNSTESNTMSNWQIVPQEAIIDKETVMVDCKEISWRPASDKEIAAGSGEFKRLGTPTFRVLYRHVKFGEEHKVVAQYVKKKRGGKVVKIAGVVQFEWRVNLHFPDRIKPKQILTRNRVTSVSIDDPTGETQVVKSSTGTSPYDSFFDRVLPENLRDASFRLVIQQLFDEAISDREERLAEAA